MIKDTVKSLREPIAWILVGAVAVQFLTGLWSLLDKPEDDYRQNGWFLSNAYSATETFVAFSVAAMLVGALLVATMLPDRIARAKPIVLIVAIESGVMMLVGILTMFLGLFYSATSSVGGTTTNLGPSAAEKARSFISDMPLVALTLIPLLLALAMFRASELSGPGRQPMMPGPGGFYGAPQPQQPQQPYPGQQYPGQQYPSQQPFPGQQQGFPSQQPQYPTSFPEWGGSPPGQQQGGYGQGWQ